MPQKQLPQNTFKETLDPQPLTMSAGVSENKAVKAAIDLIQDATIQKEQRDQKNRLIQDLLRMGFTVANPRGTRKIQSKTIQQAIQKVMQRMKPLDFSIHGSGRPPMLEKIVTDGVSTVMSRGGYVRALRDKGGVFTKLLNWGDGFIHVGTNPDDNDNIPIVFNAISNENVYVDPFAVSIRSSGWGQNATRMLVIFSHPWTEAIKLYPKLEKEGAPGRIPRELKQQEELERFQDGSVQPKTLTEIGYFYDLPSRNFTIMGGAGMTVLEETEGADYPFVIEGEAYIPVSQFICQPSVEGFYNHGIGDLLFDLAIISRRLLNMEVGHVEDNTYPITLINMPEGEAAKFFGKLELAHEMRAAGKKGIVAMPLDPSGSASGASAQSLLTQNLTNEWQTLFARLDQEIRRLGINLDEIASGSGVTATQILQEEESQNAFVKQIMEYNATESNFLTELTMDFIKKFVSKNNKSPLNLTTSVEIEGRQLPAPDVTLGMVADEIKKNQYFSRINARTGAIPSNLLQQTQVSRVLNVVQPGTAAQLQLLKQFASLNDQDLSIESFVTPATPPAAAAQAGPAPATGGAPTEAPEAAIVSETERQAINVRASEPTAAI